MRRRKGEGKAKRKVCGRPREGSDPEIIWERLCRSASFRARAVEGLDEYELATCERALLAGMWDVVRDRLVKGALRQASGFKPHHLRKLPILDQRPGAAWRNTEWIFGTTRDIFDPIRED